MCRFSSCPVVRFHFPERGASRRRTCSIKKQKPHAITHSRPAREGERARVSRSRHRVSMGKCIALRRHDEDLVPHTSGSGTVLSTLRKSALGPGTDNRPCAAHQRRNRRKTVLYTQSSFGVRRAGRWGDRSRHFVRRGSHVMTCLVCTVWMNGMCLQRRGQYCMDVWMYTHTLLYMGVLYMGNIA